MMFWRIAWFEIRFWLRSWMLWAFLIVIGVLFFGLVSSDDVMADLNLSNIYRNAPFAIASYYAFTGVFALLMTAIFANSAALRDFSYNTYQIIFSTPLRRRDLLLGRFLGATLVSVIPMLGVSLGVLLAQYTAGVDRERWEVGSWTAHLKGILLFALPDTFFTAAILFAAAVVWRRDIASFIVAILLFIGRAVSGQVFQDAQREHIRGLLDPVGARAFEVVTKYWTVADKNTLSASLTGLLLWNRLIWVGVGCAAFALAYSRFSFAERRTKSKALEPVEQPGILPVEAPRPHTQIAESPSAKFVGSFNIHFRGMAKNTAFVVVLIIGWVFCILGLFLEGTQFRGNQT